MLFRKSAIRSFSGAGCALTIVLLLTQCSSAQEKNGLQQPASRMKIAAYDPNGERMGLEALLSLISREDSDGGASERTLVVSRPDKVSKPVRFELRDEDGIVLLWEKLSRVRVGFPWPVKEDGFSTIWIDNGGEGYKDGDSILLNEELALGQYRAFKESREARLRDFSPIYKPSGRSRKMAKAVDKKIADARRREDPRDRAADFDEALKSVSLAWQKLLFEHGLQIAHNDKKKERLRFGVTLDDAFLVDIQDHEWFVDRIERSGANWVRLIFRSNPADFLYAERDSFTEYDPLIKMLREKGIRILGTVLDTAQWPKTLTPKAYAERTRNLALHYGKEIRTWDVGNEINGNWLGGIRTPLGLDKTFRITQAGAKAVKAIEPSLETVATLYWWDGTAPDWEHSLTGWLARFVPLGFGDNIDTVALSLQPDDNPVGMAFEQIFRIVRDALPIQRVMLGSFGYVEADELKGFWWLHPDDVDGARKDLMILYTAASCAMPRSLCGGFWFATRGQLLTRENKTTDLYRIFRRTMRRLGRF